MAQRQSRNHDQPDSVGSNAAMNLWQKFSDMQQSIEKMRKERDALQDELEACQEQVTLLQEKRHDERTSQRLAEKQCSEFRDKINAKETEHQSITLPAYSAALLAKERMALRMSHWKEYKAEECQTFLQESREFQSTCKRLRFAAGTLGLQHANVNAALLANSMGDAEMADLNVPRIATRDDRDENDDPSTWIIEAEDEEMAELYAMFCSKKREHDAANDHLKDVRRQKQEYVEKQSTRIDKIQLLQKQLDRIAKDNNDITSEMNDLVQLTEEAKAMAANFSQAIATRQRRGQNPGSNIGAAGRPSQQVSSSAPSNTTGSRSNPYVQSSAATDPMRGRKRQRRPAGTSSTRASAAPAKRANAVPEGHYSTSGRHQRRDKRFGSSLEVIGGHDLGASSHIEHGVNGTTNNGPSQQVTPDVMHNLWAVDDDDEDDDLLSFVAFSK